MATCHRTALANDGKGWQRKNMAWARLDDGFGDHPKTLDVIETLDEIVGAAAIGLWTLGLAYAHRTMRTAKIPGFVPRSFARTARVPVSLGDKLCDAGLWERTDGGWLIHNFDQYLPSENLRAKRAEAGRRGAEARWARESAGQNPAGVKTAGSDSNLPSDANGKNGNACPEPEPEPKEKKPPTPSSRARVKPQDHPRFPEFWTAYDHKVERLAAVKAFNQVAEDGADLDAVIAAAGRYARRCKRLNLDRHKIKHASGWLNGERWTDEIEDDVPAPGAGSKQPPPYGQINPDAACRWCDGGLYERTDGRMARCEHPDQPPAGHPAAELTRSTT